MSNNLEQISTSEEKDITQETNKENTLKRKFEEISENSGKCEEEKLQKKLEEEETEKDDDDDEEEDEKVEGEFSGFSCGECQEVYSDSECLSRCEHAIHERCNNKLICESCKNEIHESWELEGEPDGTICYECHKWVLEFRNGKLYPNSENEEEEDDDEDEKEADEKKEVKLSPKHQLLQ